MSPTLSMALRYALTGAMSFALGKGWLTSEQVGPVTDAVITLFGVVIAALPAVYAGFKIDNRPKS